MTFINMAGQKINKWSVLSFDRFDGRGEAYWICRCACGNVRSLSGYTVRKGTSKGCIACREPRRKGVDYLVENGVARFGSPVTGEFTVSLKDAARVSNHGWCRRKRDGYFVASIGGRAILLHSFLLGSRKGMYADHINGDRTDNRRENLRWATPSESARNLNISSRNTSGYKGVHWNKRRKKWQAYIRTHNRQQTLGFYDTAEDAAKRYNEEAKKQHGNFACINPIGETHGYRVAKVQYV